MPNLDKIIKSHNCKILNKAPFPAKTCNCRKKETCPMNGNCLAACIVYKAEVTTDDSKKVYYGSCSSTFKQRYANHKVSFTKHNHKDDTKLSQYIWQLHERNKQFKINWFIEKKCSPYQPSSNRCDLCLSEKLVIIQAKEDGLLNKRSEIANKCRHGNKYSLTTILKKIFR